MTITTTLGELAPADIDGTVLPHEHLFINLRKEFRGVGLVTDRGFIADELSGFRRSGGALIVDVTPAELTRGTFVDWNERTTAFNPDPLTGSRAPSNVAAIQAVSAESGVPVVLSTGHYRDPYLDRDWIDHHEVDTIADFMVHDIDVEIPGTGMRAGIIGEIGSDAWAISAAEERSFRAAARAQTRTGVALTTHAARWPTGPKQLEIIRSEGVDPQRVIIGHVDTVTDPEYAMRLAAEGVWIQLDTFYYCRSGGQINRAELDKRVQMIVRLLRAGHLERVLLSHDACLTTHAHAAGGTGLVFLDEVVKPALVDAGIDDAEIHAMMRDNPLRALSRA